MNPAGAEDSAGSLRTGTQAPRDGTLSSVAVPTRPSPGVLKPAFLQTSPGCESCPRGPCWWLVALGVGGRRGVLCSVSVVWTTGQSSPGAGGGRVVAGPDSLRDFCRVRQGPRPAVLACPWAGWSVPRKVPHRLRAGFFPGPAPRTPVHTHTKQSPGEGCEHRHGREPPSMGALGAPTTSQTRTQAPRGARPASLGPPGVCGAGPARRVPVRRTRPWRNR